MILMQLYTQYNRKFRLVHPTSTKRSRVAGLPVPRHVKLTQRWNSRQTLCYILFVIS